MPVVLTYDVKGDAPVGSQSFQSRVQNVFQRLGWEHLGGSAYRYPKLDGDHYTEDWLNHVVPALMLFRTMSRVPGVNIKKFTIDVQSSTGYNGETKVGTLALAGEEIEFYDPNHDNMFGLSTLKDWIDSIASPYLPVAAGADDDDLDIGPKE